MASAAAQNYPNAMAMTGELAENDDERARELFETAIARVQPAITYFLRKFNWHDTTLFEDVKMFKAVRILCPVHAK